MALSGVEAQHRAVRRVVRVEGGRALLAVVGAAERLVAACGRLVGRVGLPPLRCVRDGLERRGGLGRRGALLLGLLGARLGGLAGAQRLVVARLGLGARARDLGAAGGAARLGRRGAAAARGILPAARRAGGGRGAPALARRGELGGVLLVARRPLVGGARDQLLVRVAAREGGGASELGARAVDGREDGTP